MISLKTVFIVNPVSSKRSTGRAWPRIQALATERLGPFITHVTSGPGDGVRLTRRALQDGADRIVGVGGDGTLNEIVNGFMEEDGSRRAATLLGYIPRGTGCDFIRSLPIPRELDSALAVLYMGASRFIDVGCLHYEDHRGRPRTRYFHNIASFGLGGEVDERVSQMPKLLGGVFAFLWATLISVLIYDRKRVHLKVDAAYDQWVTGWNIAVANGQYHGNGMWVAPGASMDDGLFHVVIIGDFSRREVFRHIPKLYSGKILHLDKVQFLTGKKVEAFSEQKVLLDVDGEQPGRLPVSAEIVPSAIRLITSVS